MGELIAQLAEAIELRVDERGLGEGQKKGQQTQLQASGESSERAATRAPAFDGAIQSIFESNPAKQDTGAQAEAQAFGCAGNGRQTLRFHQKCVSIIECAELHCGRNPRRSPSICKSLRDVPLWIGNR